MIKRNEKGFTLVELLVVISIIGLLSTLAVVALGSARERARDAKRIADVKQIQTALELFYNDNNAYPEEPTAITLGEGTDPVTLTSDGFIAGGSEVYMQTVPAPPYPDDEDYSYISSDGTTYTITFKLEGPAAGFSDGATIEATPGGMTEQ